MLDKRIEYMLRSKEASEYIKLLKRYNGQPLEFLYGYRDEIREFVRESVIEYRKTGDCDDLHKFWREEFVIDLFIGMINRKEPDMKC